MATALEVIAKDGISALSLRELARNAGVSHGAPAHHFGDRKGLITALAIAGHNLLIENLKEALSNSPDDPKQRLRAVGIAYVQFAVDNPAYFEVMFKPELHRKGDPELEHTFGKARRFLSEALASTGDVRLGQRKEIAELRAWALAHGLASLLLNGSISSDGDASDISKIGALVFD